MEPSANQHLLSSANIRAYRRTNILPHLLFGRLPTLFCSGLPNAARLATCPACGKGRALRGPGEGGSACHGPPSPRVTTMGDRMFVMKKMKEILFILSQLKLPTQRHQARNRCGKLPASSTQHAPHFALRTETIATSARIPNVADSISNNHDRSRRDRRKRFPEQRVTSARRCRFKIGSRKRKHEKQRLTSEKPANRVANVAKAAQRPLCRPVELRD